MKSRLQQRFARMLALLFLSLILGSAGVTWIRQLGTPADARLPGISRSAVAMAHLRDALDRIDASFQLALAGQEPQARIQYDANWKTYRENLRTAQAAIVSGEQNELVWNLTALSDRYEQLGKAFYSHRADDPRRKTDYLDAGGLRESSGAIKSLAGQIGRMQQDTR